MPCRSARQTADQITKRTVIEESNCFVINISQNTVIHPSVDDQEVNIVVLYPYVEEIGEVSLSLLIFLYIKNLDYELTA